MNTEKKITVLIHTYNAEKHLRRVLDSVQGFDEILICDMESSDATLAIADEYACRVITFPRGTHTIAEPARQFAIERATYPWVLVIDADELVSPALRTFLYQHIAEAQPAEGIRIPRKNYFMGRFMHAAYPDYVLRFFRRDLAFWPPYVHTLPQVTGNVIQIPRDRTDLALEHLANDSMQVLITKSNSYSDNEVIKRKGKRYGLGALLLRPAFRFIKSYIIKGGFRDGLPGFIHAVIDGVYQFILVAKVIESKR